jgi:radical SAM protein with 4Fe4S-binding SPASM domain
MSETKKYIPINKGHFSLDTNERIKAFNAKLATGWEDKYAEYRELWNELPNKQIVSDYPLLVDLETVSVCNLACPMCPTVSDNYQNIINKGLPPKKSARLMDVELAKKVINEISGKVFSLRLSLVGEPTMHKHLIELVKYAKDNGVREVSFLTNGTYMDIEYFEKLALAGVDWITISIDGINSEYNEIRKPLLFKDTLKKLRDIKSWKEKNKLLKPVIKVQGVWPAIRPNPSEYYNIISPLVDLVAYNPLIDYLHKDSDVEYVEGFSCPQLYQRIVVNSNGSVKMCSNDEHRTVIIGDAHKQTIYEIWHGDRLNELRDKHKIPGGFMNYEACQQCYYPRKVIQDEKAKVGDREIFIENYVNRSQTIGT